MNEPTQPKLEIVMSDLETLKICFAPLRSHYDRKTALGVRDCCRIGRTRS